MQTIDCSDSICASHGALMLSIMLSWRSYVEYFYGKDAGLRQTQGVFNIGLLQYTTMCSSGTGFMSNEATAEAQEAGKRGCFLCCYIYICLKIH